MIYIFPNGALNKYVFLVMKYAEFKQKRRNT
jgi:hypothetical protein